MTTRSTALRWLASTHGIRDGDIFTSQYYPAERSWTDRDAWWVQVPRHRVEAPGERAVHLVLQVAPEQARFYYLRVPASYLRERLDALDAPGDGRMVSLFLSADPGRLFRDERGAGQIEFRQFLQSDGHRDTHIPELTDR